MRERLRHALLARVALLLPLGAITLVACSGSSNSGCELEGDGAPVVAPTVATLSISPIQQQTEVWCWAACAEMVFRYYGLPNLNPGGDFQCGIVGVYATLTGGPYHPCNFDCYQCVAPIGNTEELRRVLTGYGSTASSHGLPSPVLCSTGRFGSLSLEELARELDLGRPVLAGVNFQPGYSLPGISQHVVVLIGYDARGAQPSVEVNDPFPYGLFPHLGDPYVAAGGVQLAPGHYRIALSALVQQLRWDNTIFRIG